MDLTYYQVLARRTAIYPKEYKVLYTALGLASEAGEVAGKVKKMLRDDKGVLTEERKSVLKDEIGDVLWYVANLASDLDINLSEIGLENIEKLKSRQDRGKLKGDGDKR